MNPVTFNDRIEAFWVWFRKEAPRLYRTIEERNCPSLAGETSERVNALFPGFAWVYGPGAQHKGHSLTLSGEGNVHRQLLALHWMEIAPSVEGWTFYPARQAGPIKGHVIRMGDLSFDPKEIWVTPSINAEGEKVDLHFWHPSWKELSDQQRWTVVFLFLDESLGEYGSQWWIGEIRCSEERLADSFPLEELAGYVKNVSANHGWKKYPPGELWTLFSIEPGDRRFPRGDLMTLSTAIPELFHDYFDNDGNLEDPLKGSGADYIYIAIDRSFFPQGAETEKRGEIEEALDRALRAKQSGSHIGGGFGVEFSYVDLLIFDGQRSIEIVRQTLRHLKVPSGTMIEFFALEKRSHRLGL